MAITFDVLTIDNDPQALDTAMKSSVQRIAVELHARFASASVQCENVMAHSEVNTKNQVELKLLHKQIRVRFGVMRGVNVDFYWLREKPDKFSISITGSSLAQDRLLLGTIALSAILSVLCGVFVVQRMNRVVLFVLFAAILAVLTIPCFLIHGVLTHNNSDLAEQAAIVVRGNLYKSKDAVPA